MKFKVKTKDCRLIVKAKMTYGENINVQELDGFSRAFFRGFLRPKIIKKNLIEYTGPIGISLQERFKKTITKREFLFILEHSVEAIQKLQTHNMSVVHLILNLNNVYINEVTKEIQFIYVPLEPCRGSVSIPEFIDSIIYSAKPMDNHDNEFVSRFAYYIKGLKKFDINEIEKFVIKEDKSVVNTIKKNTSGKSGFMTNKQQHYYEHYEKKQDSEATDLLDEEDDNTDLLDEEFATDLLDEELATGLLDNEDENTGLLIEDEATGLLVEDEDELETALLCENEESSIDVSFATLFRVLTSEVVDINKPVFRLGKEKSYVDYFITNNIAVSRSHADIIVRDSRFYIKDLNSKNHTYINNQQIPVMCEIELHNGDNIKLGNEEFVFNIK